MKCWPHEIKAVVFDSDGVLMDTVPLYAEANSQIIGRPYPDSFQVKVNGLAEPIFAQRVIEEFGLDMTADEFVTRRLEILQDLLPEAGLVPGVERIVRTIANMKIPMAVATSANRQSHTRKTVKHSEFFKMFRYQLCGDEVENAKPDPEIFVRAAAKLGDYAPENVLVFEDSVNGIKAACTAGMPCVLLASLEQDYSGQLNEMNAKATLTVRTFDDFDFGQFYWQTDRSNA